MPQIDDHDLIIALRTAVHRPDILPLFIEEEVKRAKQLQRKNYDEFETTRFLYAHALEYFDSKKNQINILCELTTLSVLLRLEPTGPQRSQYNSFLLVCLEECPNVPLVCFATRVFAATLEFDDFTTKDFIRNDITKRSVKWMQHPKRFIRCITGIYLLTEITLKYPDEIQPYIEDIFKRSWSSLVSGNADLQNAIIPLFTLCAKRLTRIAYAGFTSQSAVYESLMLQLNEHLTSAAIEKKKAGLLAFQPLVCSLHRNSSLRYEDLSSLLVPYLAESDSPNSGMFSDLVLQCLLALCRFKAEIFISNQLAETVAYALRIIHTGVHRNIAFQVLSGVIRSVGDAFKPHVEITCEKIRHVFENTDKSCWEALECFSVICSVCPPRNLSKNLEACVNHVFQWGLSAQLIKSLQSILNAAGTTYQSKFEEALLDKISLTLCGLPFRQTAVTAIRAKAKPSVTDTDIALALNALLEFSFSRSDLMSNFLRDSVVQFIGHQNPIIRNGAVKAIIKLLLPPPNSGDLSIGRRLCVDAVLDYMMNVGVAHALPDVRETIIGHFTPAFYSYLSEGKYLDRFHSAIGDECINVRVEALRLLCGMMNYDPSHILPILRKVLCTVLHNVNLNFTTEDQVSDCLRLLTALSTHAPQYVVHFSDGIVDLLLPRFRAMPYTSALMGPFLTTYAAFVAAVNYFGAEGSVSFREEIGIVLGLLDTIPADRTFQNRSYRLLCYRFLAVALAPLIDKQSPYQIYPDLFRHLSSVIHSNDESPVLRLEALKCLGKIGALDVTMFQAFEAHSREVLPSISAIATLSSPTHPECCNVVLRAIAAILDPDDKRFNPGDDLDRIAVETIMDIVQRCSASHTEMHVVVAPLARNMMQMSGRLLATVLMVYTRVLQKAGKASLKESDILFMLFQHVWDNEPRYRFLAVRMFSTLSSFNVDVESSNIKYFQTIPLILNALNRPDCASVLCFAIIGALIRNVNRLQPLCEQVIESVLMSLDVNARTPAYLEAGAKAMKILCVNLRVHNMAGSIVRNFLQLMQTGIFRECNALSEEVVEVFIVLMERMKEEFKKYTVTIVEQLKALHVKHEKFLRAYDLCFDEKRRHEFPTSLCQNVDKATHTLLALCDHMVDEESMNETEPWSYSSLSSDGDGERILRVDEEKLSTELDDLIQRRGEFTRWSNRFCMIILEESPYQVFRCVSVSSGLGAPLASECTSFTNEIVLVAFRTLWSYSSAVLRRALLNFFHTTLQPAKETVLSDEAVGMVLSIVEYMDHAGEPLDISCELLSDCAWKRGMIAKAVYWREAQYRTDPHSAGESLISLYSELHMMQSSLGIFKLVDESRRRELLQSSLIKLSRYEEALELAREDLEREQNQAVDVNSGYQPKSHGSRYSRSLYSAALTSESESYAGKDCYIIEPTIRMILCLNKLGDYDAALSKWEEVYQKAHEKTAENTMTTTATTTTSGSATVQSGATAYEYILASVSEYAADSCIRLQKWSCLEDILKYMPDDTVAYHITKAVRFIKLGKYPDALHCVITGRQLLLNDLGNLHESYARSYESVMVAQELTELEEIIHAYVFQANFDSVKPVHHIMSLFENRIQMMVPSVRAWKQVLGLRGLLTNPANDVKTRIRFVQLCRIEKAKYEEKFTLSQLLGQQNISYDDLLKKAPNPRVMMEYIAYAANANILNKEAEKELIKKTIDTYSNPEDHPIVARAYARLGSIMDLPESIECFRSATLHDSKWHIGWRLWAEVNAEMLNQEYSDKSITNAIDGYIQSILLGTTEAALMQDVLKLMTLWAVHGDQTRGLKELRRRVFDIPTRVWRLIVPQLIAHLDCGTDRSCELVADILTAVALDYPNTLMFPLNLCRISMAEDVTKSDRRKQFAIEIIKKMENKYPLLILQGKLVIDELNRLASLIHERVFDKLEEAASQYFNRKNINEMVRILESLHDSLPTCPEGVGEAEFLSNHTRMLSEAGMWIKVYGKTGDLVAVQSAWNLYHSVYRQINDQLKRARTLSMQFYSPKLYEARDLEFCLPDDNIIKGRPLSKIAKFDPQMVIIASKQRPKRISLQTSDGRHQKFLLKGREDLRLDERVMQLFVLINILMLSDSRSSKNFGFQVQQYTVTPLRETAGLIGWVDGCDTMHELVKNYRFSKDVSPDLEFRLMNQIIHFEAPKSYDNLSLMSKVEVMEFLADHTSGQDIRKVMWATAPTCEIWIDQRRRYMTSLANMSMVGYILGLGDRHPNNIMLQKHSGHVVHIDFGDCFEVTMTRDKFPEKVPFRLTRMLRNAMDVTGIDGSFRAFSETSMSVLRKGSHSVLALMQAFIQDPLISWRLVALPGKDPEDSTDEHHSIEEINLLEDEKKETDSIVVDASANVTPNSEEAARGNVDYNHHGVVVNTRLKSKLEGKDFTAGGSYTSNFDVAGQVNQLIEEATDISNVSQLWSGWCPFW